MPFDEAFAGSCYAHAVRLLTAMKRGLTLRYVAAPLSAWRAENDSFLNAGRVQRSSISIEGYHAIAAALFGDASVALFGRPVAQGAVLAAFMFLLYIPLGYMTDMAIFRYRLKKKNAGGG